MTRGQMAKICISYRRSDSSAIAGRIYDRLVERYGAQSVFMDVDNVPLGVDFREHIRSTLKATNVLLALIGREWLGRQENGHARIDDESDPVRMELRTALQEQVIVIPVLLDGTRMPGHSDLPENIRDITFRNAIHVDSGVDFTTHLERLMRNIDQICGSGESLRPISVASASNQGGMTAVVANGPINDPGMNIGLSQIFGFQAALVAMLWIAHYLIIMKLDLNPIYLRIAAFLFPLPFGFVLLRRFHRGLGCAVVLGLGAGVVAVLGMLIVVGIVDGAPIIPATALQWQEALEYVGSITLATFAGNLIARAAYMVAP
jgi:hypothetical protein